MLKKIIKWLDNFWYHYKWPFIIILAFAVIITVLVLQYAKRETYDASVIYGGPVLVSANERRAMENAFELLSGSDLDGDGKNNVSLNDFYLLTDEQKKEIEKNQTEQNADFYFDNSTLNEEYNNFSTQIFVGESLVCLLDPAWYELVSGKDGFVPLAEVLGEQPENASDEYSVRLFDTVFGQYFTAFSCLPEDTLICFRRMSTTTALKNKKQEAERYEKNKVFFTSIMEFEIPQ